MKAYQLAAICRKALKVIESAENHQKQVVTAYVQLAIKSIQKAAIEIPSLQGLGAEWVIRYHYEKKFGAQYYG